MCGICGIVDLKNGSSPSPAVVKKMIGRLRHRGPEAAGMYMDRDTVLGHSRLSIIDLEGGSQPLCNGDESLWISYNGELYNYFELREELLEKGHRFRTSSDTEVFLLAYREWGRECFSRFNGQWAAAIWDSKNRTVILSRDRTGIRPLYYTIRHNVLYFASEIKALFADKSISREFDTEGLAQVFTFWCPVAPRTIFDGVCQLPPGHIGIFDDSDIGGVLRTSAYWSPFFPEEYGACAFSLDDAASELRRLLLKAVRLRFNRSDVPVGAYLSGGIDSSISSAIISGFTSTPLKTFSMQFADSEFDERGYQNIMASRLGTKTECITVHYSDISRIFPDVVWHAEQPLLRTAPAPLFLLSQLVHDSNYKVVVTGEGADEILAGYDIFREAKVREFIARDPSSKTRPNVISRLYPWLRRSPGEIPAFARAFFGRNLERGDPAMSHRPRWDTTSAIQTMFDADILNLLRKRAVTEELLASMPADSSNWDVLSRAQWLEMATLLPGYILSAQGDRMLMAHSVEGRFPFLDVDVMEFANTLPGHFKLMALNEKYILKKAFPDIVPEEILARPKQPYRAPDAASFFHDEEPDWLKELIDETNVKKSGVLNPRAITLVTSKARKRRGMSMSNTDNMRITGALSVLLCHELFIKGDGSNHYTDASFPDLNVIDRR